MTFPYFRIGLKIRLIYERTEVFSKYYKYLHSINLSAFISLIDNLPTSIRLLKLRAPFVLSFINKLFVYFDPMITYGLNYRIM